MPRIPYADPETLPENIRALVKAMPINVVRMLAGASPAVVEGFTAFSGAFYTASSLPADLREIAILRAGYIAGSDYETWQHESMARDIGLTDAQIAAIKAGGSHPALFTAVQQAALDFADEIIVNVRASDATLAAMRRHLTDEQLLDLILVTGLYMLISRLLETTGIERDAQPIDARFIENAFD